MGGGQKGLIRWWVAEEKIAYCEIDSIIGLRSARQTALKWGEEPGAVENFCKLELGWSLGKVPKCRQAVLFPPPPKKKKSVQEKR